ncbi:MAG: hypothetical protein V4714_09505 [Bacteroidota bacterium]
MNAVQQTAYAFLTVYKALPEEVRQEVKHLIEEMDKQPAERVSLFNQAEVLIAPLRKGLPSDYRFNRDEANER